MKKFSRILFVGLLATLMGCNDAIDIRQVGRLDAANAFRTVANLESGLLALYNEMDLTPEISLSANFTDEIAVGFDSGGQGFALYDFVMTAADDAPFDFWTRNFRVNNRCSVLIEAAGVLVPSAADQAGYNNALAQAHFIRAYANFEMLLYFSPNPQDDATLSVPVIDFVAPLNAQPLRNTTGELWDYINADLALSLSLIQEQSNTFFVSRDAINALRARMALTRGDYVTAETLATNLLNSYPLATRAQYPGMWTDANNTEMIFKLNRTLNDSHDGQVDTGSVNTNRGWAGSIFAFVTATLAGSPYFEMDRSVYDAMPAGDIRRDVFVAPSSVISADYQNDPDPVNNDILVIQKYPGSEGQPLMNDLKVFRSSEMLFIAAEAKARKAGADLTGAATLIKRLRDARFSTVQALPVYASAQQAVGDILDERKVELSYEGHRHKDLRRAGVAGGRGVARDLIACTIQSGACTLAASDFRFTLPIPIVEINANPAIAAQQNPGY
jgi:hypothetical protein